jgi:hypothetical protein
MSTPAPIEGPTGQVVLTGQGFRFAAWGLTVFFLLGTLGCLVGAGFVVSKLVRGTGSTGGLIGFLLLWLIGGMLAAVLARIMLRNMGRRSSFGREGINGLAALELRRTNPEVNLQRIRMVKILLLQVGAITVAVGLLVGAQAAAASAASDQAQAKNHLLGLSDMPNGWSAEKGTAGSGSSGDFSGLGLAEQLAGCIGVPSVFSSYPPYANSPYYENQDQMLEVQDAVYVFPSVKDALDQVTAISSAKTPGCMTAFMNSAAARSQIEGAVGKGATIGTITVTAVDPSLYIKNTAGYTMNVPVIVSGISFVTHLTDLFFNKGRLGQDITFNSYGTTFPTSLAKRLTSVAQGRL